MIEPPVPGEVGKEGDKVTLKCSAYGLPHPQFTWEPSGEQVDLRAKPRQNISLSFTTLLFAVLQESLGGVKAL